MRYELGMVGNGYIRGDGLPQDDPPAHLKQASSLSSRSNTNDEKF